MDARATCRVRVGWGALPMLGLVLACSAGEPAGAGQAAEGASGGRAGSEAGAARPTGSAAGGGGADDAAADAGSPPAPGSGPADGSTDAEAPAPSAPIALPDSTAAVYDAARDLAYVAVGARVQRVDFTAGAPEDVFEAPGPIVALDAAGDVLAVLATTPSGQLQLDLLDSAGAPLDTAALPFAPTERTRARVLDGTTALVHGHDDVAFGNTAVVRFRSPEPAEVAGASVYHFVYAPAGVAVADDGRVLLPSAYPGEVVEARVGEDGALEEVKRHGVSHEWLHDIVLLDGAHALIAGHIAGVGIVDLSAPDDRGALPYEQLSELRWAYGLAGRDHAYSAAGSVLLCIDRASLAVERLDIPGFASTELDNRTVPFGERAPGRVLLHQPGVGIAEVACADAAAGDDAGAPAAATPAEPYGACNRADCGEDDPLCMINSCPLEGSRCYPQLSPAPEEVGHCAPACVGTDSSLCPLPLSGSAVPDCQFGVCLLRCTSPAIVPQPDDPLLCPDGLYCDGSTCRAIFE